MGKNRAHVFPDAWVQCGRFTGKDKTRIFDHTEIHDHLPVAVERIIDFLKKHAMRGADLSQIHRRDVWSIPLTILREAVVNAVVHTDYSQKGGPIRVCFFDDRIEIENPGILLPGLTVDDIRQGVSRLRNRVIGRVFKELGLIEQWGSGIVRMFAEAQTLGLTEPRIHEMGLRYRFTVFLAESITTQGSEKVAGQVTPEVGRVIEVLQGEMSRREIQEKLGLKDDEHFRKAYLLPALEAACIEMILPDKPRSSNQKYRMTEKWKAILGKEARMRRVGPVKGGHSGAPE